MASISVRGASEVIHQSRVHVMRLLRAGTIKGEKTWSKEAGKMVWRVDVTSLLAYYFPALEAKPLTFHSKAATKEEIKARRERIKGLQREIEALEAEIEARQRLLNMLG